MRGDALQTFKNITSPNRENLGEILAAFRWKYVKPQSMATAKHKFQRLVSNPANQKLIDFLDELQKLAKDAFGFAAQDIIEQSIYAKMPPHLKKSINQAHLENVAYEQVVSHPERELELNALEAPDEMQLSTVTQQATQQNSEKPKATCHHCKKPGHYRNQCRQFKREKDQARNNTNFADNNNGGAHTNSNSNNNKLSYNTSANNTNNQKDRRPRPVYTPCETCGRTNHSTGKCYFGANAANIPPPGIDDRKDKTKSNKELLKATHMGMSKLQPKLPTSSAMSSLQSCTWQTGNNRNTKTSTNSRVCLAATLGYIYKSI